MGRVLRREIKSLVTEKKLYIWNEVLQKANSDYDGNRKEFWAFVGKRAKAKTYTIVALRYKTRVSVTSTKGKLRILQNHYQDLGKSSVNDMFNENWKQEVKNKVDECSNVTFLCG